MNLVTGSMQQTLAVATATEDGHARFYRESALRFRAFNAGASLVLKMLAQDTENNVDTLRQLGCRIGNARQLIATDIPVSHPAPEHFLIVDGPAALRVMAVVQGMERQARELYRQVLSTCGDEELLAVLFTRLVKVKHENLLMLDDIRRRFDGEEAVPERDPAGAAAYCAG